MAYDLIGKIFGDLIVLYKLPDRDEKGRTLWQCKCRCGKETYFYTHRLTDKKRGTKTCGKCEWHIKHKSAYISWMSARQRCNDKGHKDYLRYGGRGITMCQRWNNFANFIEDMGDPPNDILTGERLSLERKDNNKGYEPSNCIWATRSDQQLNKGYHA